MKRWHIPLSFALAAIPPLVLAYKIPQYILDFPYWDDLILAPFLEKAYTGQLTVAELWTQHNEHRIFFPRLIMLGLALLTRWDVRWTIGVSFLLGIGIFVLLALLARRTLGTGRMLLWAVLPVLSFFVFTWAQMENWIWSLEVTVFVCNIAVVAGVFSLAAARNRNVAFGLGLLFGVITTYSFANGMIYWFAALPAVLALRYASNQQRALYTGLWLLVGFACIALYFRNYQQPGVSPSLLTVLRAPHEYAGYVLLYLGSAVVAIFSTPPWHGGPPHPIGPWHFVPGAAGVLLAALLTWRFARMKRVPWRSLAPWLSLAAFAIGSALATGIGRVGLGIYQGLTSRYMTTNLLFWCALVVVAALLVRRFPSRKPSRPGLLALRWALGASVLVMVTGMTVEQSRPWEENATWKRLGWRALAAGYEAPLYLADLCWSPEEMKQTYLPFLRAYELAGLTKQPAAPDPALAPAYVREGEKLLRRKVLRPALTYADTALLFDPGNAAAVELREAVLAAAEQVKQSGAP